MIAIAELSRFLNENENLARLQERIPQKFQGYVVAWVDVTAPAEYSDSFDLIFSVAKHGELNYYALPGWMSSDSGAHMSLQAIRQVQPVTKTITTYE